MYPQKKSGWKSVSKTDLVGKKSTFVSMVIVSHIWNGLEWFGISVTDLD